MKVETQNIFTRKKLNKDEMLTLSVEHWLGDVSEAWEYGFLYIGFDKEGQVFKNINKWATPIQDIFDILNTGTRIDKVNNYPYPMIHTAAIMNSLTLAHNQLLEQVERLEASTKHYFEECQTLKQRIIDIHKP